MQEIDLSGLGLPVGVADVEGLRAKLSACQLAVEAQRQQQPQQHPQQHQQHQQQQQQQQQQHGDRYCPAVWDAVLCWPPTPAGRAAWADCPEYIASFDPTARVSKQCAPADTWMESNATVSWTDTNYSVCFVDSVRTETNVSDNSFQMWATWVPVVKRVAHVGYSVSLCTLILAFFILFSIKRLRCPRNNLHLHLFASFMLRASMYLLKDVLFVRGVGLPGDVKVDRRGDLSFIPGRSNWECKLITSLWQYSIMANYSWILMEGLYLHNLIFLALFSDNSAITLYVVLGWGLPASVVLPWVIGRRLFDDQFCWTVIDNEAVYYLLRVPTVITVMLSFILFLNIARVLLVKMQASIQVQRRGMRYRRWARSTMVLVPLFGTHYALLLCFEFTIRRYGVLEVAWIFVDQTFASFQGCLVALLYCLMTKEVRVEVRKRWQSSEWALGTAGTGLTGTGRRSESRGSRYSWRRPGSLLQSYLPPAAPATPAQPSAPPPEQVEEDNRPGKVTSLLERDVDKEIDRDRDKDIEIQSLAVDTRAAAGDAQSWV